LIFNHEDFSLLSDFLIYVCSLIYFCSYTLGFVELIIWLSFIPKINEIPQNNGILKFFRGTNNINGPGQSPPIPHPNPKNNDPITNLASIFPLESLNESPKIDFPLKLKYKINKLHFFSHNSKYD
jgi:hypothetical protein